MIIFNFQLVDNLLKTVFPLLPNNFGPHTAEGIPYLHEEENILSALRKIDSEIELLYGATKMVIRSPNLGGVVIKIPFNGYFEDRDENNYDWNPFQRAKGSDCSDYCLTEYEKYQKLKKYKLEFFVAETIFYKKINGKNVFIQEWVTPIDEEDNKWIASKNSKQIVYAWKKKQKSLRIFEQEWVANCIDKYNQYKTKSFFFYCDHIDNSILRDMHEGNYGYRDNGTPCILDYSDFD